MKRIIAILSLVLAFSAVSCNKELDNVQVSPEILSVPAEGGTFDISVQANCKWRAETNYKVRQKGRDAVRT